MSKIWRKWVAFPSHYLVHQFLILFIMLDL